MSARWTALLLLAATLAACRAPGEPPKASELERPGQPADFAALYARNCAACHGASGEGGASLRLNDPVFLAAAGGPFLRRTIEDGVPGTPMPGFGERAGGSLSEAELAALVAGLRAWGRPLPAGSRPPAIAAFRAGDAVRGASVFGVSCASCHGRGGTGGPKAGSVVDPAYLTTTSDQWLRTVVIAGRPELGHPDWRSDRPGRPLTEQEISDVVAWLSRQRPRQAEKGASR